MRSAAVLLVSVVYSGAFASQPGNPLDCSDWVFLEPGLTCRLVLDPCITIACYNIQALAADNAGGVLEVAQATVSLPTCPPGGATPNSQIQITRWVDGVPHVLAYVQDRCGAPGTVDKSLMVSESRANAGFEPNAGRLYIGIDQSCSPPQLCQGYLGRRQLFVIEGFATTFDVLQSFTPQASLGFRVPYMPEGMAAADHFDTYWGNLTSPIDFTQAHPLQCDYPTAAPSVGDYLTVADTVPTPAPGQGVYYVTSATYQGATRYGRKATNGQLTGRDPALLPACTP